MTDTTLREGAVAKRPPAGRSQAHAGVAPVSLLAHTQKFQPLPTPLGHLCPQAAPQYSSPAAQRPALHNRGPPLLA